MLITYIRTHLFMKDDLKIQEIFTTRFFLVPWLVTSRYRSYKN